MTSRVIMGPDYYPSPTTNAPIDFGYIYVGEPDLDPAIPANQKTLSVLQEDGNIVPVAQPVRTNAFGIPEYNGSVATLVVDGPYSLRVNNRLGVKEYLIPNSFNEAENSALFGGRPPSDYRLVGDIIPEEEGGTGTDTFETAPFNMKSKNGLDIPDESAFRINIGLSPGEEARTNLGFGTGAVTNVGTVATYDVGTSASEIPTNQTVDDKIAAAAGVEYLQQNISVPSGGDSITAPTDYRFLSFNDQNGANRTYVTSINADGSQLSVANDDTISHTLSFVWVK